MGDKLVGTELRRREDPDLLTGRIRYTDDFQVPELAYAAILRSQYAHARIREVDTAQAEALEGVISVITGSDIESSGVPAVMHVDSTLADAVETDFPVLATDNVRYVGEGVAVVIAEDRYVAHDALELIDVTYVRLDAVVNARAAMDERAPVIHQGAPDNVSFDWEFGDADAVEAAFENAAHTVSVELRNQRLIGNPMEPRTVLARYDDGELTVTMSSQTPHKDRRELAALLGLDESAVRVIVPAVGGGFGIKGQTYPDEVVVSWCAIELGRPVKWTATRSETHATDYQSRDWYLDGEMALDPAGKILGMRVTAFHAVGAYYVFSPSLSGNFEKLISGQYVLPAVHGRMVGTFTNTTPTAPYRGAGRPEAIYFVERLIDAAARELSLDPAELRRRNQIPANVFPYETVVGSVYDSGDYGRALDLALTNSDYAEQRDRQARLREEGRYLGIGISCFVENSGSSPGLGEIARVVLAENGGATAYLGTHDHGQGHGTTFSQLLVDELGIDYNDIEIEEGDTDDLHDGTGTFGSRSAALGGGAMIEAAREVKERARRIAADHLEVSVDDLEFVDGEFRLVGAPHRSIPLWDMVGIASADGIDLEATAYYDPPNYGFSFGTHIAVVEVDPETGEVTFERYVAVDDCGEVINPMIVEGQIHGGVAQGIGQALFEEAVYDDSGTLVTGSFQDYVIPKALHIPEMETDETVTPSPHNPIGVKGTGESGTIASTPAVANAVIDALEPLGVDDIDMPITPEKVWRAIQ